MRKIWIYIIIFIFSISVYLFSTEFYSCNLSFDTLVNYFVKKSGDTMSGKLLFSGDGRTQKIYQVPAGVLKGPGVNPATYTNIGLNGSYKFSDNLQESVTAAIAIPFELDISSSIAVRIGFGAINNTGNVIFQLKYRWVSSNESINDTTPDEILYSTTTVSSTAYGYTYANFNLQNPISNDKFIQLYITRLGDQDTTNSDVYVVGLSMLYYINRLGE